jgi:hypothetical protein
MPDIRVCHELLLKPELPIIAAELDRSDNETIGILVRVWIWADQHTENGLSKYPPVVLEAIIGVKGLVNALLAVGWIEVYPGGKGFLIPRLERYTGDGRTSKTRRRVARERSVGAARGPDGRFAPKNPTSPKLDRHPPSDHGPDRTVPVPVPNRTEQVLTSGEKFLAGRDERVDAVLEPWKEALLIGSPVRAREAVYGALKESTPESLLEASKAYLGSPAASEKKYACRAHTFFAEERYNMDPEEWTRGGTDDAPATGWDALETK